MGWTSLLSSMLLWSLNISMQNSWGFDMNEWSTSRLAIQWGFLRSCGFVLIMDILRWLPIFMDHYLRCFTIPVAVSSVSRLSLCLQTSLYVIDCYSSMWNPSNISADHLAQVYPLLWLCPLWYQTCISAYGCIGGRILCTCHQIWTCKSISAQLPSVTYSLH